MPVAAVLLLCWNHERYLERCISSLSEQTLRDFEVVFLDNASSDDSFQVAEKLLRSSGLSFRMMRNPEPAGIAANLNRLVSASTADLVCPLSTDDWYGPGYMENMIEAAARHPEVGLFYPAGWSYFEDQDRFEEVDAATQLSGEVLLPLLNREMPFFFVGCCYPRKVIDALGGWDEALRIEDFDFFIRLTMRYPVRRVPSSTVFYHRSRSTASENLPFMVAGWEEVYRKHRALPYGDMRAWMAETYRSYATRYADHGEPAKGVRLLAKAIAMKPFKEANFRSLAYLARVALHRRIGRNNERR